jgi:hypothetical protein
VVPLEDALSSGVGSAKGPFHLLTRNLSMLIYLGDCNRDDRWRCLASNLSGGSRSQGVLGSIDIHTRAGSQIFTVDITGPYHVP